MFVWEDSSMSQHISEEQLIRLQEVVDHKPGLNPDEMSVRHQEFEDLVKQGAINEDDPIYLKMKMVGAHLKAIKGDFPASLTALEEVLILARKHKERDWELRCLNNIALVRQNLGFLFESIHIWEDLLKEDLSLRDRVLYANNLGVAYNQAMKPKQAINTYFHALELLESTGETEGAADLYNNLANLSRNTGVLDKAQDYYLKALELYEKEGNNERLAMVYNNLCALFNETHDLPESEKYATLAKDFYERFLPENKHSPLLNNVAALRTLQQRFPEAEQLYQDSLRIAEKYNDRSMQTKILSNLALIAMELDNPDASIDYANRAQVIAHELEDTTSEKKAYSLLKDAWQSKLDFTQAYLAQSIEMVLERRLNRDNTPLDIAQAEARYLQHRLEAQLEKYKEQNLALEESNAIIHENTQELETRNNLLVATNKLLNRIISIIAHDVRGPVATITQTTEMLTKGMLQEHQDKVLRQLNDSSHQTETLINELLDIAQKYKSGDDELPESFEVNQALRNSVRLAEAIALTKDIKVSFTTNCDPLQINMDRSRLRLIIRNLLSNAIKFSHPGSTITLALDCHDDESLKISVIDSGLGMSPDKVSRILEGTAFTEPGTHQEKGFGMGLVFVLEALMHTKGKLSIISEPGHGSTFTISYLKQDLI